MVPTILASGYLEHGQGVDDRTLGLSIAAGYDLTPLIHFWGIQPVDAEALKEKMLEHGLRPSFELKEFLMNCELILRILAQMKYFLRNITLIEIVKHASNLCPCHFKPGGNISYAF